MKTFRRLCARSSDAPDERRERVALEALEVAERAAHPLTQTADSLRDDLVAVGAERDARGVACLDSS